MIAHDTNVWIYFYDGRDPVKQRRAQELLNEPEPFALLWQVGCEFLSACRKLAPQGFDEQRAWEALTKMRTSAAVALMPTPEVWDGARRLQARRSLSIWDALVISACLEGGVTKLYSEDLSPGEIDGMTV